MSFKPYGDDPFKFRSNSNDDINVFYSDLLLIFGHKNLSTFNVYLEEVTKICARSNNYLAIVSRNSIIDSITGGLSSEEEFQLDHELEDTSDSELEMR